MSNTLHLLISTTAAIALIVFAAQIFGRLARFVGQPVVVGEMVAGILLGPTALGRMTPELSTWLFNTETKPILYVLSMIGLSLYMFLVGLDHESKDDGKQRSLPFILGILGVVIPTVIGTVVTGAVAMDLKPPHVDDWVFAVFTGGALSVTAFPMLARVLQERDMIKSTFGSIAVKSAAVDDALAWCGLAIISAMAVSGSVSSALVRTVLPALVFAFCLFAFLPLMFRKSMTQAVEKNQISDSLFAGLMILVLAVSVVSDYIGIYSVFGGFIAGVALPRIKDFPVLLDGQLTKTVRCLFLPIFFAYSGLNTDIGSALHMSGIGIFAVLLCAAVISKAISAVIVLRHFHWRPGEIFAMAGLMNARGLMILIYMTIGLSIGIIETELYSIMVLIAIVTTAIAMPMYRVHFNERQERIARAKWAKQASRKESELVVTGKCLVVAETN